ncbi:mediator of DNA damage checkpoint protein 1-like isoform X2 [Carassius carassius]|uniref:mediator of DNA damage checkpoint protein 1-like isoform X2 n=1 Tax=Carassius carassius TaxID=217509 RepID=UPI0028696FB5|nr:mediator of DNA damage checkpoint protein 1-like isoform X2 [Carassius carassius]
MDATQQIDDPFSEQEEEEKEGPEREQLATLKVFKNNHIQEAEFPLYIGENVIGRNPALCSVLLPAQSVSSRHAVISISVFCSRKDRFGNGDDVEALLWDMGSLNGTRKGRFKLTPQVRYALTEGESVVFADVPCQYIGLNISKKDTRITPENGGVSKKEKNSSPVLSSSDSESELSKGVRKRLNVKERSVLPPVPLWSPEDEQPKTSSPQPAHKHPEITLVPESESDGENATDERKDFDSASSSHLCSSTNSSFLTPAKKVIPESEDESSITPSSASIDRFRLQNPDEPGSNSFKPSPLVLNLDRDIDLEENDIEKSKPEAEAHPDLAPKVEPVSSAEFHMDSDTDVEEDEEEKSKTEAQVNTEEAPNVKSDLHVDSDTDVEENKAYVTENVSKKDSVTESPPLAPQYTDFHLDSDTDVEDDNPMKVSIATEVLHPVGEGSDVRPTSTPATELHMDSDTDVDEENEDKEKVKARDLLSNSETDDEDPFKPLPDKAVKPAWSQKFSVEQSEKRTHKKQDHYSHAKTNLEEPTQAFGHLDEDWDLLPTQAYGTAGASARLKPKQLDLEATQAYGTETDMEEEQEPLNHTQPYANLSTAETQLIHVAKPDDGEEEEDKDTQNDSHLSTSDTLIIASTPKREEQTQQFSIFTAQTQLIWEAEDQEVYQNEPTQLMTDTIDETQESEEIMKQGKRTAHKGKNTSSSLIIAETQPMCEEVVATNADLNGDGFQKPSTRQHAEKYDSAYLAETNFSSRLTIAETQQMCDDGEAPDQDNMVTSTRIEIAETQPMFEVDEAPEDDQNNEVNRRQSEGKSIPHIEKASASSCAIPETQSVGEDDEGQEQELSSKTSSRRSRRCRPKKGKEVSQLAEAVPDHTITETQPMYEEQLIEDLKSELSSPSKRQQADELKSPELSKTDFKTCVTVAETQPMYEEEAACEDLNNALGTRQIDEDRSTELPIPSSSHISISETQPMHKEDDGQGKDLSRKMTSISSRRGRPKKDEKVTQTVEGAIHQNITETQPLPKEVIEKDEALNSGVKYRRSRRGRPIKKDSVPQPAEAAVSSLSINTETQPVYEDRTERDEDLSGIRSKRPRRGRQKDEDEPTQSAEPNSDLSVVGTQPMVEENAQEEPSGRRQRKDKTDVQNDHTQETLIGRSSRRQRKDKTEVESETTVSSKAQGKTRKGQEGKRKRGKALSEDEEESEVDKNTRRGTRRTGIKLKCNEKEEEERLVERDAQEVKEKMDKELQEREKTEREENERLEYERKKREECEQRERAETEMRQKLEQEQKELEEKETLKREEEKVKKEIERIQREKEFLEKEEKERLERERRELEEQRRKEEEERIQKEKEQIERERLEAERERQENEGLQMRTREQKKTKERYHQKEQKNERLDEDKAEPEAPLVPLARQTRRCSSSSMNSDQSPSSQWEASSQRGRGRGRGQGRGKPTTDEQPISARQSGRRGPASAVEDTEQNSNITTRSRSSSRSSERSAHSIGPSNQGTRGRGRGRKSTKLPEPEVVPQPKTSGKCRGRGGRHSGAQNVNVEMDNEHEQDVQVVEDSTAVPQTNSRGRKRAANNSVSPEEAPSPTPKTSRRSVAIRAHKVLFTGVTDQDGERVVSRLGGSLASGVNDMTQLVTDKARRTVKFLCAVARGVPIVTPDWLKKCGKAGYFLSTDEYILKDVEQEKKFSFCLLKSMQTAQTQPLLKGYEIHVTPSVMPEPSQMKEIITCCGARFLPKMPPAHKEHTVVVSCEQDRVLCDKAVSMSLPVVTTEFLLTGILQQRVDLQAYSLTSSLNTSNQPAAPKTAARGRRK